MMYHNTLFLAIICGTETLADKLRALSPNELVFNELKRLLFQLHLSSSSKVSFRNLAGKFVVALFGDRSDIFVRIQMHWD